MKFIFLSVFIFLLAINIGSSQDEYSASQLQSFVDIYMDAKNTKSLNSFEKVTTDKLAANKITYARYREIFHANISGENIILNENELSFFKELQTTDDRLREEQKTKLTKQCNARAINYKTYIEIREQYKSDIKFQRSLKSYFDHYLNIKK